MHLMPRPATLAALFLTGCVYAPVDLEGRLAPCVAGYTQVGEACFRAGFDASLRDTRETIDASLDASNDASAALLDAPDAPSACVDFTCDGNALVNCATSERVTCPGACVMRDGRGGCDFVPSFSGCDAPVGTADIVIARGETWLIDTENPTDLHGATSTRFFQGAGLPELRVISMRSLVIEEGALVSTVRSTSQRDPLDSELDTRDSLVLYATNTIFVAGRVDVSAQGAQAGAGATRVCGAGCGDRGRNEGFADGGGGGGGFGGQGGDGGPAQYCYASRCDDPMRPCLCAPGAELPYGHGGLALDTRFLVGGNPGGLSGGDDHFDAVRGICLPGYAPAGAGGGAIMLAAGAAILISRTGVIAAHGGGGGHGDQTDSGGGGGAGGMIVLEAPTIALLGLLTSHGGAGGTAGSCDRCNATCPRLVGYGADGRDGGNAPPTPPLAGGSFTAGVGATGSTPASAEGRDATRSASDGDSGGGGGGAGRITLRSVVPAPDELALRSSPGSTWIALEGAAGCGR